MSETEAQRRARIAATCSARAAYERFRQAALRPTSDAAAQSVREHWEPIRLFQRGVRRHEREDDRKEPCTHVN